MKGIYTVINPPMDVHENNSLFCNIMGCFYTMGITCGMFQDKKLLVIYIFEKT